MIQCLFKIIIMKLYSSFDFYDYCIIDKEISIKPYGEA